MIQKEKIIKEVTHKIVDENKDSLEIGTAKEGKIKVYLDFDDEVKSKEKIKKALEMRAYANLEINI